MKVEDVGDLRAHFDEVAFGEGIFSDDFESAGTSGWSASVGLHEPGPITFISLQATPGTVPREGGRLALLALVLDDNGWGVPLAPVSFLTDAGALDSGGSLVKTDWNGQASDALSVTAGDIDALGSSTFNVHARTVDFTGTLIDAIFRVNVQTGVPIADFTWVANRLEVNFVNRSTGIPPLSFLWVFGDGSTSTSQNPIHAYPVPGTFRVCLSVSNAVGTDTVCEDVTVTQ
jgi:hypothetical protein